MRQLFVHVVLMALTFSLGLGVDRLRPKAKVNDARPVERVEIVMPKVVEAQPAPPVTVATPAAHLIFDYDPSSFTPDGIYFINGPTPIEFREFNAFDLSWSEFEDQASSGYVGLQTYSDNIYGGQPAIFALVTERRLFFATSRDANGIEYRFDGEFVADPKTHIDTNVTVLRGMLTKSRNGRKVAERLFNFRLEFLGC
jgi:hypothetical protein